MQMKSFAAGAVLCLLIGCGASALAADVFGTGYLMGWLVMQQGREICINPLVDAQNKAIVCK